MPKVWQSESAGEDTCKKCGSVYTVTAHRYLSSDSYTIKCKVCGDDLRDVHGTPITATS